ncbi:MAG: trans-sulfuration enzyme family protein [Thermodesulfovibrionales bacterium]
MRKRPGFATLAVHAGEKDRSGYHPSSMPLYQSSTFFFGDTQSGIDIMEGRKEGFIYTRIGNPTVRAFEDKIKALEGAEAAVAFASGMAAIAAVLLELLRPGDEVISCRQVYGGTTAFYENILARLNCPVHYFHPHEDPEEKLQAVISKKTKLIFFETPTNPELSIVDMARIAGFAKRHKMMSVIDNTFATPYLQRPLPSGIDCVIHSATKYIGGHGDAVGGVVAGSRRFVARLRQRMLLSHGACLSPFNAWLFLRGLRTLHVRMDRHCKTAAGIAGFLAGHTRVSRVLYPGLKTDPGHAIAKKQMSGFGGMVSFRLGSRKACRRFIDRLKLCRTGVSLGDTETIMLHPVNLFYPKLSDAECLRKGVDPLLIRISTGLEEADDILADIEQALKAV